MTANYTLASAATWGSTVGELFDYVNGVSDVRNPFGPGDYGPSGEDVRNRFVLAGTLLLPGDLQVATLSQFESARPFTIGTPVDINHDGVIGNDRVVVNGVQTSLDEFRGTPLMQVDMRVSRTFRLPDGLTMMPFVEIFNLFDRMNPGNNYVADAGALPVPADQLGNVQSICTNAACTATVPVTSLNQLKSRPARSATSSAPARPSPSRSRPSSASGWRSRQNSVGLRASGSGHRSPQSAARSP